MVPTILFAIVILYICHIKGRRRAAEGKLVPEAEGAWPLIGHLHLFVGTPPPHRALGVMAKKYGPLFTIKLGVHPTLVVSSSQVAKEVFTINDMAASSRPKLTAVEIMGYNNAMFGFESAGPYWREVRKIAILQLLSNRRLQILGHIRVSEVDTFLKQLYTTWNTSVMNEGNSEGDHEVMVELKQMLGDLSLNVILRMISGKRYSFGTNEDEKKEADRIHMAVRKFIYFVGLFTVGDSIPYIRWLDLGGHEKEMKKIAKEMDAILGGWLEEHKRRRALRKQGDDDDIQVPGDFMDALILALEGADLSDYDADTVNKATCLNLIAAGSDSMYVTLTWAISLLLNNRHVLEKAQEELDTEVGREKTVTESDISKLFYLQAIVKETLRLYPAAPLAAPHEFNEDCTIAGYKVPKGTRLITNIWKVQTDPQTWPEPLQFKPERFLTTHKDVDVRGQNFELIPFGSGRRSCPAVSFSLQMVQSTLASFLQAFQISSPSNALIDMSESFGATNVKATPLEVLIKPRLSSEFY
ncbi:cytochrome P450 CYP82D47-like [Argentina anserina]|uniref:cytochrome P450 CYP82D47-like n=1 Tax=Argentina anserina TaxID=57926 RepID=UPI002176463B|nr:cytochrome P450 CYP82D47-like [Potentilla anserina]